MKIRAETIALIASILMNAFQLFSSEAREWYVAVNAKSNAPVNNNKIEIDTMSVNKTMVAKSSPDTTTTGGIR